MMKKVVYPSGPSSKLPGGLLLQFQRDPLRMLMRTARDYGKIAHFRLGLRHVYLLSDPDYIKDVLVTRHRNFIKSRGLQMAKRLLGEGLLTSEYDFHFRQRRLIQPVFQHQRIAGYGKVMVTYGERMRETWRDEETLDIHKEMMRLTLAIVGKTLFDADVESEAEEIGKALTTVLENFNRITMPFFLEKLPLPSNRRFQRARERLDATIYHMIRERREKGDNQNGVDLLSMLLRVQDTEGDEGGMTDLQVRDEAMTIFLAGHETTSNALTWTWYLLSQHPDVETQLHNEIDDVLSDKKLPSAEDLPKLGYTEMVLSESMRMFPPAWILGRQALKDFTLGNEEYYVPAGSTLLMSQYIMHHNPKYFPQPDRFDPERWTPERKSDIPRFAYFPFGGGPRSCIGEHFAWMEGILLIATIAQRWKMRLVPGHPVELQPRITLRPKYGMKMKLIKK